MGTSRSPAGASPVRQLDWSALRDFLTVAECGTLSAAARSLGVSQPTLTRRMTALEESLGSDLFHRSPRGLALTAAGEALLGPVREMESGAQAVELVARGSETSLAGSVRVTMTEGLALAWLPPELARLRRLHPRIDVEVIVKNTALNLLRREADIAIRLGRPRQQMELVTRRVGELVLGLYASRAYLEENGEPGTLDDLAAHTGIAFDEAEMYTGAGSWVESILGDAHVAYRANTLSAQRAAIRAGVGIGPQTCMIAAEDPELVRVVPEVEVRLEIWLVTHPGLRRTARVGAVFDFLAERLSASAPLLAGQGRPPE